jgi:hypothetical protein
LYNLFGELLTCYNAFFFVSFVDLKAVFGINASGLPCIKPKGMRIRLNGTVIFRENSSAGEAVSSP